MLEDRHGSRTRSPQILVRKVQDSLVIGICVGGCHEALLKSKGVQKHFGHRCQTISCARCIRYQVMASRIVLRVIDPQDYCQVRILGGRGYNNLLRPSGQMLCRAVSIPEHACSFYNYIHTHLSPGQGGGIPLRKNPDGLSIYPDFAGGGRDLTRPFAMAAIVLEKICQGGRVRQVIDANHIYIRVSGQYGPQELSSNPSKTIYPYGNAHLNPSLTRTRRRADSSTSRAALLQSSFLAPNLLCG